MPWAMEGTGLLTCTDERNWIAEEATHEAECITWKIGECFLFFVDGFYIFVGFFLYVFYSYERFLKMLFLIEMLPNYNLFVAIQVTPLVWKGGCERAGVKIQ
jgi:hypothetical protein